MAAPPHSVHVHMNGGEGETSYANNSTPQRRVQGMLAPLVGDAVAELCLDGAPHSIGVADLGCSSGPNALFLVSAAVDAVRRRVDAAGQEGAAAPEIRVFLNDLPGNDFNAVFRQLPAFLQPDAGGRLGPVLVFGAPGSFFGRLFPAASLHLAVSSFSLHWLSQVPPEVASGELLNKGNICAGRTSPPAVVDAYARQFREDFTAFLESRAVEVVAGGRMLLSFKGRSARDPRSDGCLMYDHPNNVLNDMAAMGLVEEEKLESFNIPAYDPCAEEVREAVEAEGSFEFAGELESHVGGASGAAALARVMRAVHETLLTRHFGAGIDMGELVGAAEAYFGRLLREGRYRGSFVHLVSLRRKK